MPSEYSTMPSDTMCLLRSFQAGGRKPLVDMGSHIKLTHIHMPAMNTGVSAARIHRLCDDSVVAGLYAVGACASNIAQDGKGYASGTQLGEGSFFGRRAGTHAAARG